MRELLINPMFDLAPYEGNLSLMNIGAWQDRKTGLSFSLIQDRTEDVPHGFKYSCRFDMEFFDEYRTYLVSAQCMQIERVFEPVNRVKYRISRKQFFRIVTNYRTMHGYAGASRQRVNDIISSIGGDEQFLIYCLEAVRACHLSLSIDCFGRRPPMDIYEAKMVEFEIVD